MFAHINFISMWICLSASVLGFNIQDEEAHNWKEVGQSPGQPIVRRQAEQDTRNLPICASTIVNSTFNEPELCEYKGEVFSVCSSGQVKTVKCVKDRSKYCIDCSLGQTFTSEDNCTACTPCKTCSPDEQIAVACTIYDDTQCELRSPTTEESVLTTSQQGETIPSTVSIDSQLDTTTPTVNSDKSGGGLDASVLLTTIKPDCKCNCSDDGIYVGISDESSQCNDYVIFYVVCGILIIILIIILVFLVCGCCKYTKLKRENTKLKQKLKNGNYDVIVIDQSNGGSSNHHKGYKKLASDDIEMTIQGDKANNDNANQNGNTSQLAVLDESAGTVIKTDAGDGLESPYDQVNDVQTNTLQANHGQTDIGGKPISDGSLDTTQQSPSPKAQDKDAQNQLPLMIPVLSEEEEEEVNTLAVSDPPYDRADVPAEKRSKSVRGRIESTPGSDPPPLPVRNKALQRSETFDSPKSSSSPVQVEADVHIFKKCKVDSSRGPEPSESEPLLSKLTSESNTNEKSPNRKTGLKRFFLTLVKKSRCRGESDTTKRW
ncbi:uncharacterized protein [Amphiura filiformis]|uniref:uncharacterized protein n=1 Tax=Amphiura filiformis TaxID=82378 RepID=UPI003B224426